MLSKTYIFPQLTDNARPLAYPRATFARICRDANIDNLRMHDLRHTFAVRRLVLWHAEGADVNQKILALSTYLGHAEIFYTYWYLTAVPELMAIAAGRFEQFADLAGDDDA